MFILRVLKERTQKSNLRAFVAATAIEWRGLESTSFPLSKPKQQCAPCSC
eukprot:m.610525 g.610525  ORF g.610525 m.610525 type:complete len:50 (+) comp58131_c0_seq55:1449-1598(+)